MAAACALPLLLAGHTLAASGAEPTAQPAADARGVAPDSPNPLAGLRFFVDNREPSWRQWRRYRREGQSSRASLMWQVAGQPKFRWFGRFTRPVGRIARTYIDRAEAQGAVPLMVVMRHQGRSCGPSYAAGGSREDRRTRSWYRSFAAAVGTSRVVIAFEPDSLGTVDCLSRKRRMARLRTLRYGVDVLSQLPNATIYLEGGASDWEPAARTARQLRFIGIDKVRGFMLNVTHYDWTRNNIRHGLAISRRVGGKPFIISTAFNGRGPVHYRRWISHRRHQWKTITVWCHPLKRGLGTPPTTQTSNSKVDAYMWIGRPGYSGGRCNGGPMPVGSWWAERALMFARYATRWEGPPAGTHFGHLRRYSLRALGAR
jgi:endoglucanase